MGIGIFKIGSGECVSDGIHKNTIDISYELAKHGYFVLFDISISDPEKIYETFSFLRNSCEAVIVCGEVEKFFTALADRYELSSAIKTCVIDEIPCAISQTCDSTFLYDTVIPMLNSKCKTFYATSVFRTVGQTEDKLRYLLKDYIRNRNKIAFKFVSAPPECTVLVRYSNKTQKNTVRELLAGVTAALKDCTYAYTDTGLAETVATMLIAQNRTLGLAESFTGGNIAAQLVNVPGISKSFKEGIVCYSNEVKNSRLRVPQNVLDTCGAVSDETAYEMAANLLMDGGYDYVVATTGNAGPTSEKPDEVGVCYIAVGNRENIDIYPYRFEGGREEVIKSGTSYALYRLFELMKSSVKPDNKDIADSNG